jgi:O-antigen/teichoic acid export membrane protein
VGRRVLVASAWGLSSAALARGASVIGQLAVARLLGPHGFGGYSAVQGSLQLLGTFAVLGLTVAATSVVAREAVEGLEKAAAAAQTALVAVGVIAVVVTAPAYVLAPEVARELFRDAGLAWALRLSLPVLGAEALSTTAAAALAGIEDFSRMTISLAVRGIGVSVATVIGAAVSGLTGAVVAGSITEILAAVMSCRLVAAAFRRRGAAIRLRVEWSSLRLLRRIGLPALLGGLSIQPAVWISSVVLIHAEGIQAFGLFSLAQKYQLIVLFVPSAVAPVLLPTLTSVDASGDRAGFRAVFRLYLATSTGIVAVLSGLLIFIWPLLVDVQGSAYSHAYGLVIILGLGGLPTVLNGVLGQATLGANLVKAWVWSDVLLGVLLCGLSIVLVPAIGTNGLAVAYDVSYGVSALVLVRPTLRALRAPREASITAHSRTAGQ